MATADRYSRLVLWLKVALPLAALAILSTLFFVAETLDPEAAIPYADVDVAQILRDQGITAPTFGGVTSSGVSVSLAASAIRPDADDQKRWTGRTLNAKLDLPGGAEITITSPTGVLDGTANEAMLDGGAVLESSTGYTVNTQLIVASFNEGTVRAEDGVDATGPAGEITAGRMELRRNDETPPTHHLVFQDRVRLVYTPVN